ncbi:hypothetical protein BDW66DRAFT_147471 [Aspergillus desertorum]
MAAQCLIHILLHRTLWVPLSEETVFGNRGKATGPGAKCVEAGQKTVRDDAPSPIVTKPGVAILASTPTRSAYSHSETRAFLPVHSAYGPNGQPQAAQLITLPPPEGQHSYGAAPFSPPSVQKFSAPTYAPPRAPNSCFYPGGTFHYPMKSAGFPMETTTPPCIRLPLVDLFNSVTQMWHQLPYFAK